MIYQELIDPMVRARAEVLRAERMIGASLAQNCSCVHQDFATALDFLHRADESLDVLMRRVLEKVNSAAR